MPSGVKYSFMRAVDRGDLETVKNLINLFGLSECPELSGACFLLCSAVEKGYIEIVKLLLKNGAKINCVTTTGKNTPLHFAVQNDNLELVEILLNRNAAVEERNERHQTPLHIAAENGNAQYMPLLLSRGASVDPVDCNGLTPLLVAIKNQSLSSVECILKLHPSANNEKNHSALKTAICSMGEENHGVVNCLLEYGFTFTHEDSQDSSLLFSCVIKGYSNCLHYLLNMGADVRCIKEGSTLLHSAVKSGRQEMVNLLLKAGGDVNAQDGFGKYPIDYSMKFSNNAKCTEIFKLLHAGGANIATSFNLFYDALKKECSEVCKVFIANGVNLNRMKEKKTPLHYAVQVGNKEMVQILLDGGANVNVKDKLGKTPIEYSFEISKSNLDLSMFKLLRRHGARINKNTWSLHDAVRNKCYEVCEILINIGANPNDIKDGETPLHIAVQMGNKDIVKLLVDAGADVLATDSSGNSPVSYSIDNSKSGQGAEVFKYFVTKTLRILAVASVNLLHEAVQKECFEVCEVLVKNGVDVNALGDGGRTALAYTAYPSTCKYFNSNKRYTTNETERKKIAQFLLNNGANVNVECDQGNTALHFAAMFGFKELVDLFLENDADVNHQSPLGWTALTYAVNEGFKTIMLSLLCHGADVNLRDDHSMTPLHQAAISRKGLVEILLEYGADIDAVTDDGKTALHFAAERVHIEVMETLLTHGANVNAVDDEGQTPLILAGDAESEWSLEAVKVLLKFGADVNCCCKKKITPLHQLVSRWSGMSGCYKEVLESFLNGGADVNAVRNGGATPLHLAVSEIQCSEGFKAFVKKLLDFGANIDLKNDDGNTALHLAAKMGRSDVVRLLLKHRADINVVNKEGKTALSLARPTTDSMHNRWCRREYSYSVSSDDDFNDYNGSARAIARHIIKLKSVGFSISRENLELIQSMSLADFESQCQEESNEMKKFKLCDYMSLNDILVKNRNLTYINNEIIVETLESLETLIIANDLFPIYGSLMKRHFKMVLKKGRLLSSGFLWFETLMKTRNVLCQNKLPILPPEIIEEIIFYLNNKDLERLILCGEQLQNQLKKLKS